MNPKVARIIVDAICPNCSTLEAGMGIVGLHTDGDGYFWMGCSICSMRGPEEDTQEGAVLLWRNLPQKADKAKAAALDKLERILVNACDRKDGEAFLCWVDEFEAEIVINCQPVQYNGYSASLLEAVKAMEEPS